MNEIVDKLYEEYDADKETLKNAAENVIGKLRDAGAIDE